MDFPRVLTSTQGSKGANMTLSHSHIPESVASRPRSETYDASKPSYQDTRVLVQTQWDGWRTTSVRFGDLEDIHWFQPLRAPRPLIHAYVRCTKIAPRSIPHD